MIKERSDLHFIFLTKRIERLEKVLPLDWEEGYDNITIGCTIENQTMADYRLPIFNRLPIKHRNIICQPLIGEIDLEKYLINIELVVVGGESDYHGRPMNYDWVLKIKDACVKNNVPFSFRQVATHFIKDGVTYTIPTNKLCEQARKANISNENN